MMKTFVFVVLIGAGLSLACQPYPRYRNTSGASRMEVPQTGTAYTTNDYLRLGSIMRSYLGTSPAGSSRYGTGLDCSQLVRDVFKRFDGRILPRSASEQYKEGREVHLNHLSYGDLVFFKTDHKSVSHVGIHLDEDRFLHTSSSRGVIISSMNETYWAKRYVGARRILNKQPPDPKK